jgi:hypothetical protein
MLINIAMQLLEKLNGIHPNENDKWIPFRNYYSCGGVDNESNCI